MAQNLDSKVRAKVWLTPDQVDNLRSACYSTGADYLQQRNEAIIALMYDTGLRVGELVAVDVDMLREGNTALYVPTEIQKDYPNDNEPAPATLELASDVTRLLSSYLNSRWKDSPALFPSRSSDRITTQGVRNAISKVAEEASVDPYLVDGTRGDPGDVTPHALRHGVAYRITPRRKTRCTTYGTACGTGVSKQLSKSTTTSSEYDRRRQCRPGRPPPESHYTRFKDNEWHYVPDELGQTISLGLGGEGEEGQDWVLTYTPEKRDQGDREKYCDRPHPDIQ